MIYVVWRPDYMQTKEDGRFIDATCPEHACREWAQREDAESADYLIVSGSDADLMVAELGSSLSPLRYIVSGESAPSYRARMAFKTPNVGVEVQTTAPRKDEDGTE